MEIKSIFIAQSNTDIIKESLLQKFNNLKIYIYDKQMTSIPKTDAYIGFGPILNFADQEYKWIHCLGAGVDRFTQSGNLSDDLILTRTINPYVGIQIANYCLAYILAIENKLFTLHSLQQKKQWDRTISKENIIGKKVVIFGTGEIGKQIAKVLKILQVDIIGISRSGTSQPYFDQVYPVDKMDNVLKTADWIINVMPLTTETTNFFDQSFFKKLNNASFINVGRGLSVDENDLINALDYEYLNYAVLDVQRIEPLPENSPLWNQNKIFITPHLSGWPDFKMSAESIPIILQKIIDKQELDCRVNLSKEY